MSGVYAFNCVFIRGIESVNIDSVTLACKFDFCTVIFVNFCKAGADFTRKLLAYINVKSFVCIDFVCLVNKRQALVADADFADYRVVFKLVKR